MILDSVSIVNSPVRPEGGVVVLWKSNADRDGYVFVAGIDVLDILDTATTYVGTIWKGSAAYIESWCTAPIATGEHNLIINVYSDAVYTSEIESHTLSFVVSNKQYQADSTIAMTGYPGAGYLLSGELDLYEQGGNVYANGIVEYVNWQLDVTKDNQVYDPGVNVPLGGTGSNGRYPFSMFVPEFTTPGTYRMTLSAKADNGFPANGQGAFTTLNSQNFGPIQVQ